MHLRTGYHFVALLYLVSGEDGQFLARQMQDAATLSEEQAEKKEVKREEFSDEGQGVAYTLLGTTSFGLMAAYLAHWNDDDVRRYTFDVLSMATSIFISLLAFSNVKYALQHALSVADDGADNAGFLCILGYSMFIVWFVALLFIIGFSAGLVCPLIPDEQIGLEAWVIDDQALIAHKELVDPNRIVYKRWGRAIATDEDGHPIFCRHRNLAMEHIEGRMRSLTVFFSHSTAFASIYAGVCLMRLPFFAQNVGLSLIAFLMHLVVVFVVFRAGEIFSCRGKLDQLVDLFFDSVDEAEVDVLGLSASYLFVFCLAFGITGVQSNFELYQLPSSTSFTKGIGILACGLVVLASSVALVVLWHRRANEPTFRTKVRELLQSGLSLVFSWSSIRAVQWASIDLCKKHVFALLPASLIVKLASALIISAASFMLILPLDKIEDSIRDLRGTGRIFKDVIIALGVVVGMSWEPVFNKSIAVVSHTYSNPVLWQLLIALILVAVMLPAWKRFILSQQVIYSQATHERRSRSYLTKDNDVLLASHDKDTRGCSLR